MKEDTITLHNNINPPVVDIPKAQEIYARVVTDDFDVVVFNSLLAAVVTYLDVHGVDFNDSCLPWAESLGVEQ